MSLPHSTERAALRDIGRDFHRRGWSLGTSSNYSVVVSREPLELLITASGADKGQLGDGDFVVVDARGEPRAAGAPRPSAETLLHCVLAARREVGAVLHTHSVAATVLSDRHAAAGGLAIEGYEMLKGLAGVATHEHRELIPVLENTQDMRALAAELTARLEDVASAPQHGVLLRRHGLYTWGRDVAEARRHVEVLEFLFEVMMRGEGAEGR